YPIVFVYGVEERIASEGCARPPEKVGEGLGDAVPPKRRRLKTAYQLAWRPIAEMRERKQHRLGDRRIVLLPRSAVLIGHELATAARASQRAILSRRLDVVAALGARVDDEHLTGSN